jgi:hypothetical protein
MLLRVIVGRLWSAVAAMGRTGRRNDLDADGILAVRSHEGSHEASGRTIRTRRV